MARGGFGSPPSSSTRRTCISATTGCRWSARRWLAEKRAPPDAKAVVCRELGPPERLRLESFEAPPLGRARCASPSMPPASTFRTSLWRRASIAQARSAVRAGVEAAGEVTEVADGWPVSRPAIASSSKCGMALYADEAVVGRRSSFRCHGRSTTRKAPPSSPRTARLSPLIDRGQVNQAKCCWCMAPAAAWARRGRDGQVFGSPRDRGGVIRGKTWRRAAKGAIISCCTDASRFATR